MEKERTDVRGWSPFVSASRPDHRCLGLGRAFVARSAACLVASRGATMSQQVVTNAGVVTTNYVRNDNALVTEGQFKRFTEEAVNELNAHLTNGAGVTLNTMVSNWMVDYQTNGYSGTSPKPSDLTLITEGQTKTISHLIYGRLYAEGAIPELPYWSQSAGTNDAKIVNIGQLKTIFDFDVSNFAASPRITSAATVSVAAGIAMTPYTIAASNSPTNYGVLGLIPGLTVNSSTGVISGTPTMPGVYPMTLTASNASGTGYAPLTLTVTGAVLKSPAPRMRRASPG